jgi:prolyl oligopeptidase
MIRQPALALSLLLAPSLVVWAESPEPTAKVDYPAAPKGNQVDNYHGTKVADPYRWLENPDSPESRKWIEAENKLTFHFLDQIPQRAAIKARLKELWDYEKFSAPEKEQSQYFFRKNSGLQNQSVIYTTPSFAQPPRELLNPNSLSPDGTIAVEGTAVSDDAKLFA